MARGALVPDDVTIKMVMDWVSGIQGTGGFLLDGFPRTLPQAEALDKALAATGGIDTALYLNVPKKELVRRLSGRLLCRVCQAPFHIEYAPPRQSGRCDNCGGELYTRDDDKPEAVRKRIQVYLDETSPLVEYYRKAGTLREIDGQSSIEQVRAELLSTLKY
jgi:adenylate kinase